MDATERPIFYYDLGSPYSCLAPFRIDSVLPVKPTWQPVWIVPIVAASGREWRRSAEERLSRAEDIERRAAEYGMPPWRWPDTFAYGEVVGGEEWEPANTLTLMRLATFAHQAGVGEALARRAFQLAFAEGRDTTTVGDEVIAAAVACGLDEGEARASAANPDVKQALRSATDVAVARRVIGMPTVAVGDQLFWGDDRLEEAAAAAGVKV